MRTQPQSGSGQISPANGKFMARSAHHHGQEARQATLSARRQSDSKSDCQLKTIHRRPSVATKRPRPVAPLTTPPSQTCLIRRPTVAGGGRSVGQQAIERVDGLKLRLGAGRKTKIPQKTISISEFFLGREGYVDPVGGCCHPWGMFGPSFFKFGTQKWLFQN